MHCSYGHDTQTLASDAALCQLWPQEHLNITMTTTVLVDTTTEVTVISTSGNTGDNTGNNTGDNTGSASTMVQTGFIVDSAVGTHSLKQSILWVFLFAFLL